MENNELLFFLVIWMLRCVTSPQQEALLRLRCRRAVGRPTTLPGIDYWLHVIHLLHAGRVLLLLLLLLTPRQKKT